MTTARAAGTLLMGGVAALVAVSSQPAQLRTPASVPTQARAAHEPLAAASPALYAAYVAARQAEGAAESRYHARRDERGLVTSNAARGVDGHFDARGVTLSGAARGVTLSGAARGVTLSGAARGVTLSGRLEARELRCGARTAVVGEGVPELDGAPNRVAFDRRVGGGFTLREWYVNGPLGLEQGFDVDTAPGARAACADELVLALATPGFSPTLVGAAVRLASPDGAHAFRYAGLTAIDAAGRALPARLGVTDGGITLAVNTHGATWPLVVDPLVYLQGEYVWPKGAPTTGDSFGWSVALDGNTAIIGAWQDDQVMKENTGSAYVFVRDGEGYGYDGCWYIEEKLYANDSAAGDGFGFSVALDGDTAIVGAFQDDIGVNPDRGSAYVFARSGVDWIQQAKLISTFGAMNDGFGGSVAISGNTALVGAPEFDVTGLLSQGSAFVFVRSGGTWSLQAQLVADGGDAGDLFGQSVSLSGGNALVGAPSDDDMRGAAYVFIRTGATWSQQAQLIAADRQMNDQLGKSVALDGETALVGAYRDEVDGDGFRGSAEVFVRTGTSWAHEAKLIAADGAANDELGASVALDGDSALVGAQGATVGGNVRQGAAYLFTRSSGAWSEALKLVALEGDDPTDGVGNDQFGNSVALSGRTTLVGAWFASGPIGLELNQGAAYFGLLLGSAGETCIGAGQCESGFCADGVCCDVACDGQCEACAELGREGGCRLIAGTPRGERAACAGGGTACGGVCGGVAADACAYAGVETECSEARCDSAMLVDVGACDGAGGCAEPAGTVCEHGCTSGACLECSTDDHCAAEEVCTSGACSDAPVVASPYGCGCRVGSAPATPARHAPLALLALLTLLALVGLRRATR